MILSNETNHSHNHIHHIFFITKTPHLRQIVKCPIRLDPTNKTQEIFKK